jgi:hypothetical protein
MCCRIAINGHIRPRPLYPDRPYAPFYDRLMGAPSTAHRNLIGGALCWPPSSLPYHPNPSSGGTYHGQ